MHSIRWRTVASFTALILICIVGISGYLYAFFKDSYMERLASQLTEQAWMISSASAPYFSDNDSSDIDTVVKSLSQSVDTRFTVIDADGAVLGDSYEDPSAMGDHADRPEVSAALSGETAESIRHSDTLGYDMMYVAVPLSAGGEIVGCARAAVPLTQISSYTHHILITIVWVSFLAALAAFALALQLSRVVTGPVHRLTEMARRISEGDLDQEIVKASRGEIGELDTAFNLMASKIREMIYLVGMDRDRMSVILSQMSDGIVLVDAEGKITLINDAAADIFKAPRDRAVGRAFVEAVRDYEIDEMVRRCLRSGERLVRMVETSRPRRMLMAIATPLEGRGSCLVLFQDLTEMKRLETIRRDFVSNISHELRIPIASIKALAETLHTGAIGDEAVAMDFLSKINDEADRLTQLVQELGELSRLESGEAKITKVRFDIGQLIGAAVRRLQAQADRAGIRMKVDIEERLPKIDADMERIEQVLVNLLHNAVKFTPPGGSITVTASGSGNSVRVSVSDTGGGIPAKDLPRIFERFYRIDAARSREGGGTGLGLSIARHTMRAHGGDIDVWSQPDVGSSFTVSFPLIEQEAEPSKRKKKTKRSKNKKTVEAAK